MLLQDAKPSARTRAAKLWSTLFYGHVHRPEDRDTVVKGDTMLARCYRASPWAYALLGSTMVALSARLRVRDPGYNWQVLGLALVVESVISTCRTCALLVTLLARGTPRIASSRAL